MTVEVLLYNYPGPPPYQQSFDVYVAPSCNSTDFIMVGTPVRTLEDIGINEGPYVQLVPTFTLTTEEKAAEYLEVGQLSKEAVIGHCGALSQKLEMVDGS